MNTTLPVVLHLQGPSRASQIIAGTLVPEIFATILFAARIYSRVLLVKSWGLDDTFLAISWVGSLVLCICSCLTTKYGSGHHIWDIPPNPEEFIIPFLQIVYGAGLVYYFTLSLTKISVCLFYLRLFVDDRNRILVYITIGWICLYTIPTLFYGIFQCKPVNGSWNVFIPSKCTNTSPGVYANSAANILTDIWLIVFIIPHIWSLQLERKRKVALFTVITLSWLVVVSAIVRLIRLSTFITSNSKDGSWEYFDISIWSGLEVSIGIFCVSAPATTPFFKLILNFLSTLGANFTDVKDHHFESTTQRTPVGSQSECGPKGSAIERSVRSDYNCDSHGISSVGGNWTKEGSELNVRVQKV